MARSHPPTLLTLTERTLREECALQPGGLILAAVSGGGDSMALLHVLSRLAPRLDFRVAAHGVDHGLRPAARAELELAAQLARDLGVPFTRSELQVAAGGNLQARARSARFAALRETANELGAYCIATAHHADDRAETVLLRLLRGTSPRGLAVLPPRAGDLIRPCIRAPRAAIRAHLIRHQLAFAEDPSNRDPRFLRTRVRQQLMPLLEALSPNIVENLTTLADEAGSSYPSVEDTNGEALNLGRAQRAALRRLVARGGAATRVRVGPEQEIALDSRTGRPKLRRS